MDNEIMCAIEKIFEDQDATFLHDGIAMFEPH